MAFMPWVSDTANPRPRFSSSEKADVIRRRARGRSSRAPGARLLPTTMTGAFGPSNWSTEASRKLRSK